MGIPTFFRSIISNQRDVIQGTCAGTEGSLSVDYFFMDFNSIIYKVWYDMKRDLPNGSLEKNLIERVVDTTKHLVNNVVKPLGFAYISMDGPAPRAKMVQQRSRRYKSVQSTAFLSVARKKFGEEEKTDWDPSSHICPGTVFMDRLSKKLQKSMARGEFLSSVFLSDSNTAGEGEHKILPRVRGMVPNPVEREKTVVIYSPDGDMISLSLLTQKSNMYILRYIDPDSEHERPLLEKGHTMLYLSIDKVRQGFASEIVSAYSKSLDETSLLLDYNFLLAMVGNDFVPSLPFLKIRSGGLDLLIDIYKKLRPQFQSPLVSLSPLRINMEFFKALIVELAKRENTEMRKEHALVVKEYMGKENRHVRAREELLSPYKIVESRYYHMCLFHPDHPLAHIYRPLYNVIDYTQDKHVWKGQYYKYFCGWDPTDFALYNSGRTSMVKNYLESLMFTMMYYTSGCPSWSWSYQYRVAPLPSDVFTVLDKQKYDMNSIRFDQGSPCTPFQQLAYILPPKSCGQLLPVTMTSMVRSEKWRHLYPDDFMVDALAGIKYIYSEAILPEMHNCDEFFNDIRVLEDELTEKEKQRNRISRTIKKYIVK